MRLMSSVAGSPRPLLIGLACGVVLASALFLAVPGRAQQAPAQRQFNSDAGLVLNYVKPDKVADFEASIQKLKEALAKSEKPERKQQAAGWRVFKAVEPGPNGSALYVFLIDPSVKQTDYTVGAILQEGFPAEIQALFKAYSESYAGGQIPINLTLVHHLGK